MYCASSYETWLGVFADTRGVTSLPASSSESLSTRRAETFVRCRLTLELQEVSLLEFKKSLHLSELHIGDEARPLLFSLSQISVGVGDGGEEEIDDDQ